MNTQLEKEISAVKTVLDVSRVIISGSKESAEEKKKLITVLDDIYSTYQARLIGHEAMTIAIRNEKDANVRARISTRTETEIRTLAELVKK